jgi:hypothetical protein
MVKLGEQFRDLSLKKDQDPDVSISGFMDIHVRLDDVN